MKLLMCLAVLFAAPCVADMVRITGGSYRPLYLKKDTPMIPVKTFYLDKYPVTNRQFYDFVRQSPQWQRGRVARQHSDERYLSHWQKTAQGYAPKTSDLDKPVTYVSWFAAQAYCRAQSKHLPTIDQWEYAGRASAKRADGTGEAGYKQTILNWYANSNRFLKSVGQGSANYWGVHDMHGLIWEWTEDFNSSLLSASGVDSKLFCSGASIGSADPSDYAAFLRYGFRTSLQAHFGIHHLGFRCAR